ncbi:hypothetical protein [Pelobacter seleniigenes]|uniref:hypothetical protein n=1 Tax=Pelobacter seleniigenes TaxID=407188 RepID=UPI0012B99D9C|nr:hypothetical protein [Pelobacter seleniigenes]
MSIAVFLLGRETQNPEIKVKTAGFAAPPAAFLFVQADKKETKNGLLITRDFRLFWMRYSYALVVANSAGLVTVAFNHGAWPLPAVTSSNAPDEKHGFSYWRIQRLRN